MTLMTDLIQVGRDNPAIIEQVLGMLLFCHISAHRVEAPAVFQLSVVGLLAVGAKALAPSWWRSATWRSAR